MLPDVKLLFSFPLLETTKWCRKEKEVRRKVPLWRYNELFVLRVKGIFMEKKETASCDWKTRRF